MQRHKVAVSAVSFAFPRPGRASQASNGGGHYSADRIVDLMPAARGKTAKLATSLKRRDRSKAEIADLSRGTAFE
jgi:hypothetical protein